MENSESITYRISPQLKRNFIRKCRSENRPPSNKLRMLVEDYVNPKSEFNIEIQLIDIINKRITHHTDILVSCRKQYLDEQLPLEKLINQIDISKHALCELTEIGLLFSGAVNSAIKNQIPPCEKCGMPSHPFTGALCASDDCIGKVNQKA